MAEITVLMNDRKYKVQKHMTYYDFLNSVGALKDVIGILVNNKIVSLGDKIDKDVEIKPFDKYSINGLKLYASGLKMLFEIAVKNVYSKAHVSFCYEIPNGIVAELDGVSLDNVDLIKEAMDKYRKSNEKIKKLIISNTDAIDYYKKEGLYIKAKNVENIVDPTVTLYNCHNVSNYYYTEMPYSLGIIDNYRLDLIDNKTIAISYLRKQYDYKDYLSIISSYKRGNRWLDVVNTPYINDINSIIAKGDIKSYINMCELKFNEEIRSLVVEIAKNKKIKCLMLSGPSASGKTTVIKRIASFLKMAGLEPIIVSLDDYFVNRVDSPKDSDGNYDFECLECLDLNFLDKQMKDLFKFKEVHVPSFNFITGIKELTDKTIKLKKNSIVLIEGLHAINENLLTMIPKEAKYNVYISPFISTSLDEHNYISSQDVRMLRRMLRDYKERGRDAEATIDMWQRVKKGEDNYIIPLIKNADKVLNTSLAYEVGCLKVLVEPLLYQVPSSSIYYNDARKYLSFLKQFYSINIEYVPHDSILREFLGGLDD